MMIMAAIQLQVGISDLLQLNVIKNTRRPGYVIRIANCRILPGPQTTHVPVSIYSECYGSLLLRLYVYSCRRRHVCVFSAADVTDVTLVNVSVHVLNTVYVAVDMSVTGVPMCMSHAYHTIVYGLVYLGFAVSYWAAGGTNVSGLPYIYTVLDFDSRPTSTAVWVGGILIAILCMHVLLSGVYRLRVWAYGRLRRRGGERRGGQTDLPI